MRARSRHRGSRGRRLFDARAAPDFGRDLQTASDRLNKSKKAKHTVGKKKTNENKQV
jgi:hypothetical protein